MFKNNFKKLERIDIDIYIYFFFWGGGFLMKL